MGKNAQAANKNNRIMYLEYMRVISIFLVIFHHIGCQGFNQPTLPDGHWMVYNVWLSSRWGIGTFVMISGILFLGRDIDVKIIIKKYVLHIVTAFFVWKFIYAIYESWKVGDFGSNFLREFLNGPFHFWYMPMIAGVYLCIPIFRLIVKDEKVMKYYLILSVIFQFVFPQIKTLLVDFAPDGIAKLLVYGLTNDIGMMMMDVVFGYGFYFVFGYFMHNSVISKKQEVWIYVLGLIGYFSTLILRTLTDNAAYYDFFTVNILLETIAAYTFIRLHICGFPRIPKLDDIVVHFSKWSFGAYLVHLLVISVECEYFNIFVGRAHPVISVPIIGLFTFLVSIGVSAILNQIPFVKKYLV